MEFNRWSLLGGLLFALPGCRSWDEVRSQFVEPVNQFLHKKCAKAWESMSMDEILDLYSQPLSSDRDFRERKSGLLRRFANIEYASSIIIDLKPANGEKNARAHLLLKLRGRTPNERKLALDQRYELVCVRQEDRWQIAEESLLGEELSFGSGAGFREEAAARGIKFQHDSRGVRDKNGVMQKYSAGSGLAVGDYDGDAYEDVFLVGGTAAYLYRNSGDGTFSDVTRKTGIRPFPEGEGRFAVFADYDNDGRNDLFVGVLDAPNLLYHAREDGTFEEVAAAAGLKPAYESVGAAFADFNNDGYLDLYLVNGGNLLRKTPDPMYNALNATPNVLYMSNGNGTFTDRTAEAGVGNSGWGLDVATADYDLDGDVDIAVGNDVGYNVLYRNRGDGTFEDVTLKAGLSYRGSTMGIAWGDVNNDGYPEIFAAAMESNSRWMVEQPAFPSPAPWYINLFLRATVIDILKEMFYGNRFYLNNGDGTFREVAEEWGVRRGGWAWSALFLDADNDGLLDVYQVNGFISGKDQKDL
jgi:hypothetical protein